MQCYYPRWEFTLAICSSAHTKMSKEIFFCPRKNADTCHLLNWRSLVYIKSTVVCVHIFKLKQIYFCCFSSFWHTRPRFRSGKYAFRGFCCVVSSKKFKISLKIVIRLFVSKNALFLASITLLVLGKYTVFLNNVYIIRQKIISLTCPIKWCECIFLHCIKNRNFVYYLSIYYPIFKGKQCINFILYFKWDPVNFWILRRILDIFHVSDFEIFSILCKIWL